MMANHMPLLRPDHGSSSASATTITSGTPTAGVLTPSDTADWFRLYAAAGPISISAQVIGAYAGNSRTNLDIQLTLLDAAGAMLAVANPAVAGDATATLPASISTSLPATGAYFISVARTGNGDPVSSGYSTYGSVGQYQVRATFTAAAAPSSPPSRPPPNPPLRSPPSPAPTGSSGTDSPPVALQLVGIRAARGRSRMQLTFRDRSVTELSFVVQRCQSAGCFDFVQVGGLGSATGSSTGTTYSFTDTAPTARASFSYRVLACPGTGQCSAPSNVLTATAVA